MFLFKLNVLAWHCIHFKHTILWYFICILHCVLTTQSLVSLRHHLLDPLYPLHPPPTPCPSGNHHTLSVWGFNKFFDETDFILSFSLGMISPYLMLTPSFWTQIPKAILIRGEASSTRSTVFTSRPPSGLGQMYFPLGRNTSAQLCAA